MLTWSVLLGMGSSSHVTGNNAQPEGRFTQVKRSLTHEIRSK